MKTQDLKTYIDEMRGQSKALQSELNTQEKAAAEAETLLKDLEVAGWMLSEAAIETQNRLKSRFEDIITAALVDIFDKPVKFVLEFKRRGNNLQCAPWIEEGGELYSPRAERGGSMVDGISFIARPAVWELKGKKTRPTFFMDEPFKNLRDPVRLERLLSIIQAVAKAKGLQLIITTHDPAVATIADRHFIFEHDGEKTNVTVIDKEVNIEKQPIAGSSKRSDRGNKPKTGAKRVRA